MREPAHVTTADFEDKVVNSKEPVLVFFRTPSSMLCGKMTPALYQ
jgi:thioredoxin-like negative regulator of GroEL